MVFDMPVNVQVGKVMPCNSIFNVRPLHIPNAAFLQPDYSSHGHECKVMFVSPVEMRVLLAGRFLAKERRSARPQTLLVFKSGVLGNVGTLNRAFVSGSIEILAPENPIKPLVIIDGPLAMVHGDVHIDLGRSMGNAGRPFTDAQFDLTSSSSSSSLAPSNSASSLGFLDAPLRQLLHSAAIDVVKNHRLSFVIPAVLLQDYVQYTLYCSLWNMFGEVGSAKVSFSKMPPPSSEVADVVEKRLQVAIVGPDLVSRSATFSLVASPVNHNNSRDSSHRSLKYHWFVIKSSTPGLKIKGHSQRLVVFEGNTLNLGRHVFGLRTLDPTNNDAQLLYTHVVEVTLGQPVAEIQGGSRMIGSADVVDLQVIIRDLTPRAWRAIQAPDQFNYTWRCYAADRQSPCVDKLSGAILEFPNTAMLSFDAALLSPGEYEIEVQAKANDLISPASIVLIVSAEPHVPQIHLSASDPLPGPSDARDVVLKAVVMKPNNDHQDDNMMMLKMTSTDTRYTFTWESLSYCAGQYFANLPNIGSRFVSLSQSFDELTIPASALLPGASYCFRVTVADLQTGERSLAFRTVSTRQNPEGGWCELVGGRAIGDALTTPFTVACHGWTADPSVPNLTYQLIASRRNGEKLVLKVSENPVFTTRLDVGHYMLHVEIVDGAGAKIVTPVRQVSTRVPPGIELAAARSLFILNSQSSSNNNNFDLVGVVSGYPAAVRADLALNTTLLSHVLLALEDIALTSDHNHVPFILNALQKISPPKLSVDHRPIALKILSKIARSVVDASELKLCSLEMAQRLISALQPVIANPRGGTAASFLVQETTSKIEECVLSLLKCGDPPFQFDTKQQSWQIGHFDPSANNSSNMIGSFKLPIELKQLTDNKTTACLAYRHIQTINGNLMKNATVDNNVVELRFRNETGHSIAPWFSHPSRMNITFSIPLSKEAKRKISYRRATPKCVWFDRGSNSTSSWWSDEGCQVLEVQANSVACSCTHLTEFSIALLNNSPIKYSNVRLRLLYLLLSVVVALVSIVALIRSLWSRIIPKSVNNKKDKKGDGNDDEDDDDDTATVGPESLRSTASTID